MLKKIQVFGLGCTNCQRLYQLVQQAVQESGVQVEIEKVENLNAMVAAGIMRTPALGFDGKVVLQGKIPTLATLKNMIQKRLSD